MPDIKTFSIGFDSVRHDESKYSISVAKACGVDHHMVGFSEEDFARFLPEIASVIDEPLGDQAALPTYKLCKEASRHVKVVLSGEGADEFFGGYSYYGRFAAKQSFLKSSSEVESQLEFMPFWLSQTVLLHLGFLWLRTTKFGDCWVRSRVGKPMINGRLSFFLTLIP